MKCIVCGRNRPKTEDGICSTCTYRRNHGRGTYQEWKNNIMLIDPRHREQKRKYGINFRTNQKNI